MPAPRPTLTDTIQGWSIALYIALGTGAAVVLLFGGW
jgi:hypothetical protein